jgi:hypothetical protein
VQLNFHLQIVSPVQADLVVQITVIRCKHALSLFLIAHYTTIAMFPLETGKGA